MECFNKLLLREGERVGCEKCGPANYQQTPYDWFYELTLIHSHLSAPYFRTGSFIGVTQNLDLALGNRPGDLSTWPHS
jgi:hypothetical protein